MLHSLALVKIKYRCTKHFFKSLLQVAFIYRNLPAKLFNGYPFTDMLSEQLPWFYDLLPVGFICQKLTTDHINILFTHHAIHAVQQQHLYLGIDVDIFKAVGIIMIQQCLDDGPCFAAKR